MFGYLFQSLFAITSSLLLQAFSLVLGRAGNGSLRMGGAVELFCCVWEWGWRGGCCLRGQGCCEGIKHCVMWGW